MAEASCTALPKEDPVGLGEQALDQPVINPAAPTLSLASDDRDPIGLEAGAFGLIYCASCEEPLSPSAS